MKTGRFRPLFCLVGLVLATGPAFAEHRLEKTLKLEPGGEFRIATDHPIYLDWALMVMQRHGAQFEWLAEKPADFLEPPGGWIETRYGAKSRREGRRPYYLRYRRV